MRDQDIALGPSCFFNISIMITQIYNGNILIPGGVWVNGGSVVIKDSKIIDIYRHSRLCEGVDKAINAGGGYVLPGGIICHAPASASRSLLPIVTETV